MSATTGKLVGIAVRSRTRAIMQELDGAEISAATGVEGDFRGRPGSRQVTVLASEDWEAACRDLGQQLPWTMRRANLLVEGVQLPRTKGANIRLGEVVLAVTGETDPCARMDEQRTGLKSALAPDWRGGVCCRVLQGGKIEKGMSVELEQPHDLQEGG